MTGTNIISRLPALDRFRHYVISQIKVCAPLLTLAILAPYAQAVENAEGLSGEINVGGSMATGNTDTTRFDAEFKARFNAGRMEDNYRLLGEFADDNGSTTAQRILASVESRYDMRDRLFVFGFLEFDDDKFSGFKYEIEGAFGAGYKVFDDANKRLLIQAGPGYRYSKFSTPVPPAAPLVNSSQDEFVVRGSADFEYDISATTSLTNNSIVTWDSSRTTLENTTALTSTLLGDLATRLSFNIRHNTDPPLLTKKTDTLTKVSLVYGF